VLVRDHLRKHGWEAHRVPSSGAAQGFKGDVHATKEDRKLVFEVKSRKCQFAKVYELYFENCRNTGDDLLSFVSPAPNSYCIDLATSLEAVLTPSGSYGLPQQDRK